MCVQKPYGFVPLSMGSVFHKGRSMIGKLLLQALLLCDVNALSVLMWSGVRSPKLFSYCTQKKHTADVSVRGMRLKDRFTRLPLTHRPTHTQTRKLQEAHEHLYTPIQLTHTHCAV